MNTRKLLLGLTALIIVVGLLLACFTPGGWFNKQGSAAGSVNTPFGSFQVTANEARSSAWPIVGYVLLGVGAVGWVAAFAMKSPPGSA